MTVRGCVVTGVLAGLLVWTGQATAGWVIDEVVKGGGGSGRRQVVLQANRMKTVTFEGDRPAMAVIVDLDAETITQVDYHERRYTTGTAHEYARMVQGATSGAMKQMEEALKAMPPEQRKMAEQMMASRMPQMGAASGQCRAPKIELRRTGQQETIAGHPAVRYDVVADGTPRSELWIAPGITAWKEMDRAKLERFGAEMAKLAGCGAGRGWGVRGADPSWQVAGEGYPVRTVDRSGGATVEVVGAESRTVPAAELSAPAGFTKKSLEEWMPPSAR